MRFIFSFLFVFSFLFSADFLKNKTLLELFDKQYYSYICMHRWIYINKYEKKNEKLLSVVAFSCLKKHYLTPALDLAKVLRMTEIGRTNATYINTLFMIKLLLEKYIKDNYPIENISLPKIEDSILAKVFYLAQKQKPKIVEDSFEVKDDKDNTLRYRVTFKSKINNIIIETIKNSQVIKKDKYW